MPQVTYQCEFAECTWETKTDTVSDYVALYQIHVKARHPDTGTAAASRAEKAKRPELTADVSEEDWSYFTTRWTQYKKATGLKGDDIVNQLLECCGEQLRRDHHRTFSGAHGAAVVTEQNVLAELKQIAVCKRNKAVNRVKLKSLTQDRGEPIRKFAGRVRSLAAVNGYSVKCTKVDCDQDDTMDLETLLKFIKGKESGLASQSLMSGSGGVSAVSQGRGQDGHGQDRGQDCGQERGQDRGQD